MTCQRSWKSTPWKGCYITHFPEECFPNEWLACQVPVFFDFEGIVETDNAQSPNRNMLWALLPGRAEGRAVILGASRQGFINVARQRPQIIDAQKKIQQVADFLALQRLLEYSEFERRRRLVYRRRNRFSRRRLPKF